MAKMYLNGELVDAPILDPMVQERSQVLAALQAANNALQDASKDVRAVQLDMKRSAGRLQSHEKQYANTNPLPKDAQGHRDRLTAAALIDYQRLTQLRTQIASAQAELANQQAKFTQVRGNVTAARNDVGMAASVMGRAMTPALGAAAVGQMNFDSQEFRNLVVTGSPAHGYDDPRLNFLPNVRTEKLGQTAGMLESAIDNGTNSTWKLANQTTERGGEATGKIADLMARKSTNPGDRYANLSAGYTAAQNVYRKQNARVAGLENMAKAKIHTISETSGKGLNGYDAGIRGLEEGRGGVTPNKLHATRQKMEGDIEKIGLSVESQFGPGAAGVITDALFSQVKQRKAAENNAVMVGGVRAGVTGAEEDYSQYERLSTQAAKYRTQGKDRLADMTDQRARTQFTKASKSFGAAVGDFGALPQGLGARERGGWQNTIDDLDRGIGKAAEGYDAEDAAKVQQKARAKLDAKHDQAVSGMENKFAYVDNLRSERKTYNAEGRKDEAEVARRSGHSESQTMMRQIAAMEALARQLEDNGQAIKGASLRDTMKDMQGRVSANLKDTAKPFGGTGIGDMVAGGLKDIPVVGRALHGLFGSTISKSVEGSMLGQFATGVGAKMAGQAIPEALEGSSYAAKGMQAVQSVQSFAGSAAGGVAAGIAAPIAVAVGTLGLLNSKANKDFGNTANARNEEINFGNVGNRLGTKDRLLDDIRDPVSKHLNDGLLKMRYGSGDYATTVDAMHLVGLDTQGRRAATMTAMQFSRGTGMDLAQSGALAGELGRSDASKGMNVQGDLMKFAAVIKQGVKEGVASDEMTRNFSNALERSKTNAGGIVSAKGRSDLMDQMLAGLQSGNARLKGDAGASTMGNMNDAVAGFQGKDVAFAATALRGKSAKDLGLSGQDAKTYDTLLNTAKDPYDATRFALKNQTSQTRGLIADRIMQSAAGSPAVAISMLEKGLGVDLSTAASAVEKATGKDGKLIPGAKLDVLEMFRGNVDKSKVPTNGMDETQAGNKGFQTASTQEMRANEVKLLAEKVIFSSDFAMSNIRNTQDIGTGIQETRNNAVESVGNKFSDVDGQYVTGQADFKDAARPVAPTITSSLQNGPQTGNITDVLSHNSPLSYLNLAVNPVGYMQNELQRVRTGRASGGYGGDGGKFSEAGVYHGGEYIINSEVTARMRPQLDRINGGGSPDLSGGTVKIDHDSLRDMASMLSQKTLKDDLAGKLSRQDAPASPQGLSGLLGQGIDTVKRWFGKTLGGGSSGGGNPAPGSSASQPQGVASGGNSSLASMGEAGVSANWAEATAGYCSRFVRQVFERSQGKSEASGLFGATAIKTGNLWKKKGYALTPEQVKASGGYRPGDLVFQMHGSGGAGHVGIVTADGQHVAENSTRGRGGKMITAIDKWGPIDEVGRYPGVGGTPTSQATAQAPGRASATPGTARSNNAGGGSLDSLIGAMGVAEGWGLKQVDGKWQMARHNAATTAPFGLLGDSRAHPELMRDPQLLHDFMVGKLTGRVLPSVAAMGVKGFGSTVIPGLVGADGQVTGGGMSALQKKWAPTGVANDPRHLNENWLSNVTAQMNRARATQTQAGTAQQVSVVISGNVGIDGKPSAAMTHGVVNAIVKGLAKNGIPVKVAPVQSARPG